MAKSRPKPFERQTVTINLAGVSRQVEISKEATWSPWVAHCSVFCKFPSGAVLHRKSQPVVFEGWCGWEFSPTQIIVGVAGKRRAVPVAWDSQPAQGAASV